MSNQDTTNDVKRIVMTQEQQDNLALALATGLFNCDLDQVHPTTRIQFMSGKRPDKEQAEGGLCFPALVCVFQSILQQHTEKKNMGTERLFKASEYREAEAEHKRNNPTNGDYWWEDHLCPVLVVLAVAKDFVTICRKTKDVDDKNWTWDLTQPEILSRADFVKRLEYSRCGGTHSWAVWAFERGCV